MERSPSRSSHGDFSIDEKFQAAVEIVHNLPPDGPVKTSTDEKLVFYSLYKQATVGPCNTCRPRFWSIVEKFKWEAWDKLGTMDPTEAKRHYVNRLLRKIDAFNEEYGSGEWMQGELYELLLPKLIILGLHPAHNISKNSDVSDECDVEGPLKHSRNGVLRTDDGVLDEDLSSDVEYVDARQEQCVSRASSRTADNPEAQARQRRASELNECTARCGSDCKISNFTVMMGHRCAIFRDVFRKMTLQLMAVRGISWKTMVILIVWPFVANMIVKMFRNLIGV